MYFQTGKSLVLFLQKISTVVKFAFFKKFPSNRQSRGFVPTTKTLQVTTVADDAVADIL